MRTISTIRREGQVSQPRLAAGPRGLPLLGSLIDIQKDYLGFMTRVARQYGEIASYRLGNLPLYQVNSPQGIQHILQDKHHNYIKGEYWDSLRQFAGNGLIVSEGAFWLRQRRLMQPVFHRQRIHQYEEIINNASNTLVDRWCFIAASRQPVDINRELTHLTMEIVTRALFSTQVSDEGNEISQAITTVLDHANYLFATPFYPSLAVPTPRNRRARRAMERIDEIIYKIIAERRRSDTQSNDLLSLLMEARDQENGEGMSDRQLHDEVLTIFIAGHETTAVALTWCLFLLSQHPDVERRLRCELESVLGGRAPTIDDLPALSYTRQVLDETLRLYPPAWASNRSTLADDEICGYFIPANSVVVFSPYVIHHDPRLWDKPETFDPGRFAAERSAERHRFAYFPFGGGPHQCIGMGFALVEAQLVLAAIMQRYRMELVPGYRAELKPSITLHPNGGMPMVLRPVMD
jgi:cytochrome P450